MKVAVYGTLKKRRHNSHFLSGASFLYKGITQKNYSLYVDGLPFLIEEKDGAGCEVEVYDVDDTILNRLDRLEGHPYVYRRESLWITNAETGEQEECLVYVYQGRVNRNSKKVLTY